MSPLFLIGLISIAAEMPKQIHTPNYNEPLDSNTAPIAATTSRSATQHTNVLSPESTSPSKIQSNAIPTEGEILEQFDKNIEAANSAGATTYLIINKDYFNIPGCNYYGQHPRGAARTNDGKYNSASILLHCNNFLLQIEITDFTQATSPAMKATIPADRATPIPGGTMTSSFAEASDGRLRQDYYAIGNGVSAKAIAKSVLPIFQDEAKSIALEALQHALTNPPEIRPAFSSN